MFIRLELCQASYWVPEVERRSRLSMGGLPFKG